MNPTDQNFWMSLFRTLALESAGVVVAAWALNLVIRPAIWRRAIWQAAVVCLLLLTASELSGFGKGLAALTAPPRVSQIHATPITPAGLSSNFERPAPFRSPSLKPSRTIGWPGWLWLAGFVVVLGRIAVAQVLFVVARRKWPKVVNNDLNQRLAAILGQLGHHRPVQVFQSSNLASPIAFGIFRPAMALPPNFAGQFAPATQEAVLAHELAHLTSRDPLWYLIADVSTALLWWQPLIWWARHQLHRACELAADQATVIVPEGPVRLAECLVNLGRQMTQSRGWELMGVNMGGFGSNLGERVEALMKVTDAGWRPRLSWRLRAAKTVGTVALAGMAVGLCGWISGPSSFQESWRHSAASAVLMAALDTNVSEPTLTNPNFVRVELAVKIQNAKLLYELGKYAEAEAILKQVLFEDPSNKAAAYYLDLIANTTSAAISRVELIPNVTPNGRILPVLKPTSQARRRILSKLEQIRIPEVSYDLPLTEVIKQLRDESQKQDPEGIGLNFMLDPGVKTAGEMNTPRTDLSTVQISFNVPLRNLRLKDVLDAIAKVASQRIIYTIADYAVIFSPAKVEGPAFQTRVFKVDPNILAKNLAAAENAGAIKKEEIYELLNHYCTAAGVDLTVPGKVFFYKDRKGQILVRATQADLEIIEHVIELLNEPARK